MALRTVPRWPVYLLFGFLLRVARAPVSDALSSRLIFLSFGRLSSVASATYYAPALPEGGTVHDAIPVFSQEKHTAGRTGHRA